MMISVKDVMHCYDEMQFCCSVLLKGDDFSPLECLILLYILIRMVSFWVASSVGHRHFVSAMVQ